MRRLFVVVCVLFGLMVPLSAVHGASAFADPGFEAQWQAGEAIVPNFWGPLATAANGQIEKYKESPDGVRLVQYFDKGRMELTNPASGTVTNGLLATELITGKHQIGDNTFVDVGPSTRPVAGDPSNPGPTYAQIQANAAQLLNAAAATPNAATTRSMSGSGTMGTYGAGANETQATIADYDQVTQHNISAAFVAFRAKVGLLTIGYAISEPFWSNVQVAGQPKDVLVQAFQRRVLTYTPSNPDTFKVEFGNIGRHYRNADDTSAAPSLPPSVATTPPAPNPPPVSTAGVTFVSVQGAKPGNVATVSVQTAPNASCSITYKTPKGTESVAQGLVAKTADANGNVAWSWLIGGNTTPGTGTVTVTCNNTTKVTPITIG